MLAYLSLYTHRIAISNRRLVAWDDRGVTFNWKDYRTEGADRYKTMTLSVDEFLRRFQMHVLPRRFHRIRHAACPGQVGSPTRAGGLFANGGRADNIARARVLLGMRAPESKPAEGETSTEDPAVHPQKCPCCGGRMLVIETFERGTSPRYRPATPVLAIGIDSS